MMSLKYIFKGTLRNSKKSFITILVSFIVSMFVLYYLFLLNENMYKIDKIYDTTPVTVKLINKDLSNRPKYVSYIYMKKSIDESKMIKNPYYSFSDYFCLTKERDSNKTIDYYTMYLTSNISKEHIEERYKSKIIYLDGYDDSIFKSTKDVCCIMPEKMLSENKWKLGDMINMYAPYDELVLPQNSMEMKIVGYYVSDDSIEIPDADKLYFESTIYCPFFSTAKVYGGFYYMNRGGNRDIYIAEAEYELKDTRKSEEFKNYIKDRTDFYSENVGEESIRDVTLYIDDDKLKTLVGPLQSITSFMELALPFIMLILGTIGFGVSYLMAQSKINDIALMRAMGQKRRKICFSMLTETAVLSIIGATLGLMCSIICFSRIFEIIPSFTYNLTIVLSYVLIYTIGATIALLMILRLKAITVLTRKE